MAGTLTIGTLSDGTNSTSSTNAIKGSAKAWVNFNGTGTVAIRASYNVSSITDNGTGDYTVNFTTAMSDANYAVVSGGTKALGQNQHMGVLSSTNGGAATLQTTTAVRVGGLNTIDYDAVSVAIFR